MKTKRKSHVRWLTVKAQEDAVEMSINGPIGEGVYDESYVSASEFADELKKIPKNKRITLRINSEGGSVKDGLGIYNALRERRANLTAYVDGYAMSIASIIPLAAKHVISPISSVWMIHDPYVAAIGNADDLRKRAEELDTNAEVLAQIYASETGHSQRRMRELMKDETWFTGKEAVEFGLADRTEANGDDEQMRAKISRIDFSSFKNVPQHILNMAKLSPIPGEQQTNMNTKKLSQMLAKTGLKLPDDASEEDILAGLEAHLIDAPERGITINNPQPEVTINTRLNEDAVRDIRDDLSKTVSRLSTELAAERTANVTRRIDELISDCRLTNGERKDAIMRASADPSYLEILAKRPQILPGGSPIIPGGYSFELTSENPLDDLNKVEEAPKRWRKMRDNWSDMAYDAFARDQRQDKFRGKLRYQPTAQMFNGRPLPRAENTYSASLITQFLLDGAVTVLQNKWPALRCFTRDFSVDRYKPRATAQLKTVASATTAVQQNATNFESGDTTVNNTSVAVSQFTCAFHVTNDQLNSGLRMENLVEIQLAHLADSITTTATTPITAANFTATPLVSSPGSFSFSDMQTLWGQLKKSSIHNCLLDGEYLARIINVPTIFQRTGVEPGTAWAEFGWDNIALNTIWTGADPNVRGFACHPQSIAVVAGLPLVPPVIPGATLMEATVTIPGPDISIAAYSWFSLASRTAWASFDIMFGASLLDGTAGILIKSA